MSELELLQKEAAQKADEHTGETDPNAARTDEWFGFYYGYILAKQQKQANGVDTSAEPALHKHVVIKRAFASFNWWQWLIFCILYSMTNQIIGHVL